ncbi:MAG: DUF3137 domain-containing protein [Treponema sp.]|nr:DUF3137 domain-containing protein [Treponema sp.]
MKANLTDAELVKKLESLNTKRENFSAFIKMLLILLFLNIAVIIFLGFVMPDFYEPFMISILVITSLFSIATLIYPIYGNKMKMLLLNMIEDTLKKNFESIEYKHDSHISEAMVRKIKFFYFKRIYGSDFVRATYKGVGFEFSDIWLNTKSKDEANQLDHFKGQWLVISMAKEINPPVTVSGLLGISLSWFKDEQKMVKMENEAFNKQFTVFTEDPQKAFYVLTPHFMEFIMSLNQLTDIKLHLCFAGFHAYIIANTGRNSFYPYDKDGYGLNLLRNKMQREVDFIKRVIDGFLQNERLFGLSRAT